MQYYLIQEVFVEKNLIFTPNPLKKGQKILYRKVF